MYTHTNTCAQTCTHTLSCIFFSISYTHRHTPHPKPTHTHTHIPRVKWECNTYSSRKSLLMSKCCHPVQTAQHEAKTMPSTPAGYYPLQPHMDPSHTRHDWRHSARCNSSLTPSAAALVPAPVFFLVQQVNSPCSVRLWFCQMPASHCSQWGSGSVRCQPLITANAALVQSDSSLSLQAMWFWFSQMPASHCSQCSSGSVRCQPLNSQRGFGSVSCHTLAAANVIPHVLSSFLQSKKKNVTLIGLRCNQHHC